MYNLCSPLQQLSFACSAQVQNGLYKDVLIIISKVSFNVFAITSLLKHFVKLDNMSIDNTLKQAESNFPFQLFRSWWHNNGIHTHN